MGYGLDRRSLSKCQIKWDIRDPYLLPLSPSCFSVAILNPAICSVLASMGSSLRLSFHFGKYFLPFSPICLAPPSHVINT